MKLALDADLQEIADMPSNTGSSLTDLENEFLELKPQIQDLDPDWYIKMGPESPLPAVAQRRIRILEQLHQTLVALQSGQSARMLSL